MPEAEAGEPLRLTTPLRADQVAALRAGQRVAISGVIYGARDAAHQRLVATLEKGEAPPVELAGQVVYYVGPTPAPPGRAIGAAGPTTAARMDRYTPALLARGLRGMIGKGPRSAEVVVALRKHGAVYFGAIGGAGALLARHITAAQAIAYQDLGPEAIWRLVVNEFPVVVINDCHGGDAYAEGRARWRRT